MEALIETFLEDLGVTPEEFAHAVQEQERGMNKTVLHSLLAVDDFLQFKNLMMQRNVYLQKQVARHLEAIAAEGLAKAVGVSNFSIKKIEALAAAGARLTPAVLQVRLCCGVWGCFRVQLGGMCL